MTGLDPTTCVIMEIAVGVTKGNSLDLIEGPNLVLHVDEKDLATMDTWCVTQHGRSGLTNACRLSKITAAAAEVQVIEFLLGEGMKLSYSPLAGNSVWTDRMFLIKYMPRLAGMLHYRTVDVSTLKELGDRFVGVRGMNKVANHRALDDIKESVEELKHYLRTWR
ncbi:MAG: hypothetical protein KVP17_001848 [Porospora cf. gigantea B]|uniref:uncharacterized protein n=1 Tax=Porospora cf. gigantea B TaxID=2853592 RepID=UPI003571C4A0|nr:MAG: hypothetical protein KVP17_001848 [Porospora cf. gigantea B]